MNRNIKYKQVSRIMLFGDDDINTSGSNYVVYPSTINGITVNNGGSRSGLVSEAGTDEEIVF